MATEFNALKAKVDFSEVDAARGAFKNLADEIPGGSAALDGFSSVVKALENPLLAVGVALATAVAGSITLAFQSIEAADKLNDLAIRTGKTVEYLQILGDVATKSGSDLNTMLDVLDTVQKKSVAGGEEGKKTGKAYEYLGISARDANGKLKDSATLLEEGAAAMERLGHSTDATAAYQDAFGAGALKVLATTKDLSAELDKQYDFLASVGALMDKNLVAASDNYNDSLVNLGSVFKGFGNEIARVMLPLLDGLVNSLINSSKNSGLLAYAFDSVQGTAFLLISALKGVLTFFVALDNGFSNIVQTIKMGAEVIWASLSSDAPETVPKIWEAYKNRIVKTNEDAAEAINKIWSTVDAAPVDKKDFKKRQDQGATKAPYNPYTKPEKPDNSFENALIGENKVVAGLINEYYALYGVKRNVHQLNAEALIASKKFTEAEKEEILAKAKLADSLANGIVLIKDDVAARKDALEVASKMQKVMGDDIANRVLMKYGATATDAAIAVNAYNIQEAEKYRLTLNSTNATKAEIEAIEKKISMLHGDKDALAKGKQNETQLKSEQSTFAYGWDQAFSKYKDDATNAAKNADMVFGNASKNMEDAIVNFAKTGKFSFADFASSIIADLARIAARKAVMGMFSMFGLKDGGAFDQPGVKAFAKGDVFNSPTNFSYSGGLGQLGEAGPESVMPLKRNASGQLGVIASGSGGGTTQNISIAVTVQGGNTNAETGSSVANKVAEQFTRGIVRQELMAAKRTGGMLNPV